MCSENESGSIVPYILEFRKKIGQPILKTSIHVYELAGYFTGRSDSTDSRLCSVLSRTRFHFLHCCNTSTETVRTI